MKVALVKGSTSVILTVFIQDSSKTTGEGLGSLIHTSSIVGGYVRAGGTGVALAVDEDVSTEGTYQAPSAAGKVRIGTPANQRTGVYELHFHNDLFATGADILTIVLGGATNMAELPIEVQLTTLDLNTVMRGTDDAGLASELAKVPKSDGTSSWNATALAAINGEVVDVMATDTHALPGQEAPTVTPTYEEMQTYLYKFLRNKQTENKTTGEHIIFADDGTTEDHKATHTDDGNLFTKGEMGTGA